MQQSKPRKFQTNTGKTRPKQDVDKAETLAELTDRSQVTADSEASSGCVEDNVSTIDELVLSQPSSRQTLTANIQLQNVFDNASSYERSKYAACTYYCPRWRRQYCFQHRRYVLFSVNTIRYDTIDDLR